MQISQFFVNGDIKGAVAYMRDHEEFRDILPSYLAIFEEQKYRNTKYLTTSTTFCVSIRFIFVTPFSAAYRSRMPRANC